MEKKIGFLQRFYVYQKERFPFLGYGIMVATFSFSAISYSRVCRGLDDFVSWKIYLAGIFITFTLFLLLRISDEFKDAKDDAKYRTHLPVPRGLVSLSELRDIGIIVIIFQLLANLIFFPKMLLIYCCIILYLALMWKEFFIGGWLKKHQFWYVASHMFIIPFIDMYASGLDWFLHNSSPPAGLLYFFLVSYFNGIVLEIGRKIRTKDEERTGVQTYTSMLGQANAIWLWILTLLVTLGCSVLAAYYVNYGAVVFWVLAGLFLVCIVPAALFLFYPKKKYSKLIEAASALWTVAMYLILGGVPMIQRIF